MKIIFSSVLFTLLFLTGCSSSNDSPPPPKPTPPPATVSVDLKPTAVTLDINTSEKFQAFATDENGLTTDVTDNASWALVNNTGAVELDATDPSLVKALAVGNDDVTASFGGVTSDPSTVTVEDKTLVSIAVTPTDVTMVVGTTQAFTAEGTYAGGSKQDLTDESTWDSNNKVFVTMDGHIATAVKAPSSASYITATFETIASPEFGAKVETFDVILSLEMTPDVTSLFDGQTQHYRAFATYAGTPTPQDITDKANWTSSDTGVLVALGNKGVFRAIGPGTATITASHTNAVNDKIEITKDITVSQVFLDRIEIRPSISTVVNGNTRDYVVWGINTDLSEYRLDFLVNLTMTVSDGDKAYITKPVNGVTWVLTATAPGDVTVSAEYLEPANPPRPPELHTDRALLTINP